LRRWPIIAVITIVPYFGLVITSVLENVISQQEREIKIYQ
jgi:hypothetical protein